MKDYSIWHSRGARGSSGPITRILEGTSTVTRRPKRLNNALTTDPELKELSIYLTTDSADFISEFFKFFTSQYEEYIDISTLRP